MVVFALVRHGSQCVIVSERSTRRLFELNLNVRVIFNVKLVSLLLILSRVTVLNHNQDCQWLFLGMTLSRQNYKPKPNFHRVVVFGSSLPRIMFYFVFYLIIFFIKLSRYQNQLSCGFPGLYSLAQLKTTQAFRQGFSIVPIAVQIHWYLQLYDIYLWSVLNPFTLTYSRLPLAETIKWPKYILCYHSTFLLYRSRPTPTTFPKESLRVVPFYWALTPWYTPT